MYETLTTNDIADKLLADENAGWSPAGAYALAEYLQELEDDIGEESELDVVALRCEYSEYPSAAEAVKDCNKEIYNEIANDADELYEEGPRKDELVGEHIERECLKWYDDNRWARKFKEGVLVSNC